MPKIKILDCTLRDGGLTNKFRFEEQFVKEHMRRLAEARVDYLELGYKASGQDSTGKDYGPLKFCADSYVSRLIEGMEVHPKLAFMIDVGRFNRDDIADAVNSPFVMGRVACYLNQIEQAINDARFLHQKGYETTINIMAISTEKAGRIQAKLRLIKEQAPFVTVYVVDSYGALYPSQLKELVTQYKESLSGMPLGIHAHNNLQLAFSNTITAVECGAVYADASVKGMGRGGGNCPLECLLPYASKGDYDLKPILTLISNNFRDTEDKQVWGFCTKQLLTGIFNRHPVKSIQNQDDLTGIYEYFQSEVEV